MSIERSISMIPALWSPGLSWKELQEERTTGRSWDTQIPLIGDTLQWEPRLKVAKVGRCGCAEIMASQREWVWQKVAQVGFQMLPLTSAMKMIESPAACQRVMEAEKLQRKAVHGQVWSPRDSRNC